MSEVVLSITVTMDDDRTAKIQRMIDDVLDAAVNPAAAPIVLAEALAVLPPLLGHGDIVRVGDKIKYCKIHEGQRCWSSDEAVFLGWCVDDDGKKVAAVKEGDGVSVFAIEGKGFRYMFKLYSPPV